MNALEELIDSLSRLPGIGKKSATRLAYHLLQADSSFLQRLSLELATLQERIVKCSECGAYTEDDPCHICSNNLRDRTLLCVVATPQDVQTIEAAGEYCGLFHVLGGLIAPLEGIGPEKLSLEKLLCRVKSGEISEVIIATNPTVEGDTTALYLNRILESTNVKVTRLASGLPVGGDLEYADKLTLSRSFRGRVKF
ncbi:MAG: recombination protein RecR [Treponema sp.]|nr:recombination protein RecR [Treponema sp.]